MQAIARTRWISAHSTRPTRFPALPDGTLLSSLGLAPASLRGVVPEGESGGVAGYNGIPGLRFVPTGFKGDSNSSSVLFSSLRAIGGSYDVKEAFTEFHIPLLKDVSFAKSLELQTAGRWADYSGSGNIWAYKFGVSWALNDQIRFRATQSRDVRAATLQERFDQTRGGVNVRDPANNRNLGHHGVVFRRQCRGAAGKGGHDDTSASCTSRHSWKDSRVSRLVPHRHRGRDRAARLRRTWSICCFTGRRDSVSVRASARRCAERRDRSRGQSVHQPGEPEDQRRGPGDELPRTRSASSVGRSPSCGASTARTSARTRSRTRAGRVMIVRGRWDRGCWGTSPCRSTRSRATSRTRTALSRCSCRAAGSTAACWIAWSSKAT